MDRRYEVPESIVNEYIDRNHVHGRRCRRLVGHLLGKDEETVVETRQSYLSSLSPGRVFATNKRLIIVRPSFWGLYFGKNIISPTQLSMIPYKNIISIVVSKGRLMSTIHLRLQGVTDSSVFGRNEGVIKGIRHAGLTKFTNFLEEIIERRKEDESAEKTQAAAQYLQNSFENSLNEDHHLVAPFVIGLEDARRLVTLSKNRVIWLGLEPTEYIAQLMELNTGSVTRMDPRQITAAARENLNEYQGCVFVSYSSTMSEHIVGFLRRNGVTAYCVSGGIIGSFHSLQQEQHPPSSL